ncbi:hypothetical protein COHA_009516 [Chlorella ohadii]|uniref:F-box domain-containing protein n=1 Tax=Chlorella ohadii TaxID=2649997 RepID=A0AAD5GXS9_9CHLO|nr:hypothetical protein COHA_009516 [Chlorella ohadii]
MAPPLPSLPAECLLHIVHLAASQEPGAAPDADAYLRQLLAVGGVCRRWRAATLDAPFDAELNWAQLRRFAAQVLATDARATALRRLAVSGSPQLAQDVLGGVGVAGLAVGALRQQEMYQALWSELGLQRAQGTIVELSLHCGRPPTKQDWDVTPSILLRSLHMVLQRGEPWPRLQHLGVSCPFVHETIGGSAFLAHCFPELRSLEWRQLLGTQEAWAAIVASPGLCSHLTRLCLGIAFDPDSPRRRHTPAFQMPSLAPLAHLQELEIAYADWFRQDDAFGWADLEGSGDLALRQAGTTAWLPPGLPHLRAAGAAVLLPGVDDPYPQLPACPLRLAGLEASLQTLMFVTDLGYFGRYQPLARLPTLPALRALGIASDRTLNHTTMSIRISDLLSKLPALTHLFLPTNAVDMDDGPGTKYRLELEPQSPQQLQRELAQLAARHIKLFFIDANIPEMQIPWRWPEAGMAAPSDVVAIVAGGRLDATSLYDIVLVGGADVDSEAPACFSLLVREHERAVEFAREQGWSVLGP